MGLALAAGALPATAFGQVPNGGRPAIGTTQLLHPVIQPSAAQAQIHAIQPVPGQIPQATANVSGQIAHLPGTFYQPQATANVSVQAAHLPGTFYQPTGQSTGAAGISTNARNMSTVTSAAPDKSKPPQVYRQMFTIPPDPYGGGGVTGANVTPATGAMVGGTGPGGGALAGSSLSGQPTGVVQTSYQTQTPLARATTPVTCVLDDRRHFCTFDYATLVVPGSPCHCGQYPGTTQ